MIPDIQNPQNLPPVIKAYLGVLQGVYLHLDNGTKLPVRTFASHREAWQNRRGYFNVWYIEGRAWGTAFQAVFIEDKKDN